MNNEPWFNEIEELKKEIEYLRAQNLTYMDAVTVLTKKNEALSNKVPESLYKDVVNDLAILSKKLDETEKENLLLKDEIKSLLRGYEELKELLRHYKIILSHYNQPSKHKKYKLVEKVDNNYVVEEVE